MNKFGNALFAPVGGTAVTPPTFARTGNAYLDGVSYAANTARFPNTAGTVGVLVEESTTNNALQSQDLASATWVKNNVTISADATTAPDGTLTADKVVENTTASVQHYVQQTGMATAQPQTWSFYAKPAGRTQLYVNPCSANAAYLNLDTLTVTGKAGTAVTYALADAGNGWVRVTVSVTGAAASGSLTVWLASGSANSYTGDGSSGVYLWGFQYEAKAYSTQYVPTSGATSTRNAETLTIPTAGILRPDRGTVIVRAYLADYFAAPLTRGYVLFNFSNSADGNNRLMMQISNGTGQRTVRVQTTDSSGNLSDTAGNGLIGNPTGWHIFGVRYGSTSLSGWMDGASKASVANPFLPATVNASAYAGLSSTATFGNLHLNNPIAYVVIYDRALSDAEMAQATIGNLPAGYTALIDFRGGTLKASGSVVNNAYDDQLFGSIGRAPYTI